MKNESDARLNAFLEALTKGGGRSTGRSPARRTTKEPRLERVCERCSYRTTRPVPICPICEVPLRHEKQGWTDARHAIRVPLPPGVQAALNGQVTVTVLDLSPLGAGLEHVQPLLPAQPCLLTVPPAARLALLARVVWSRPHPVEPAPGQVRWVYRSGVEFLEVPPPVARGLAAYLDRVSGAPRRPPARSRRTQTDRPPSCFLN